MVPRVDMTAMEDASTLSEVLATMRRTGYSRIPIYHGSVDRIVGIAHIKDIISPILDDGEGAAVISGHMRTPDYVPDTKDIIPLLSEMQTSHDQMVIVVDEYGGTAGVITIEDIVEEVVGEIEDEFDPDNKYITQLSDREWLVDGRFPLDDAIQSHPAPKNLLSSYIIVRHIRPCNHYFVLISRISFLIGRTNVGDTDNSSIPILRNVSVRVISAPSSPQIPTQHPALCPFSIVFWIMRSTAG